MLSDALEKATNLRQFKVNSVLPKCVKKLYIFTAKLIYNKLILHPQFNPKKRSWDLIKNCNKILRIIQGTNKSKAALR
jgi:hypothetical protein